jgi:hypothetical protein
MEKQTGIWIDRSKAIVVSFVDGKEHLIEITSDIENAVYHGHEGDKGSFMGTQHIGNERKFQERRKYQTGKFLQEVISLIKDSNKIYIFGPAGTKRLLKRKLEHDHVVNEATLIAIETADSMTLNQVVAKVKEFFYP